MLNCPNFLQPQTPTFLMLPPPPLPLHHFCIGVVYTAVSHTKIFEIPQFRYFRTLCLLKPQCNTKLWKAELQTVHKTEGILPLVQNSDMVAVFTS